MSKENFDEYYEDLIGNAKPATVNVNTLAMNTYLAFLESKLGVDLREWKNGCVKIKRVQFLEDILTMEEYDRFMSKLKESGKDMLWVVCKIMATTGMRISETLNVQRKHIEWGFIDFTGKGGKERRVYFTKQVQADILEILDRHGIDRDGFVVSYDMTGQQIHWSNLRRLQKSMSVFAENKCGFKKGLVHPHGFRHFFAKNFVKKYQNIALLADLLGHSNIETTRIYLKYTSRGQADIVNEVVTW